jgi:hypothetical protein
MRRDGRKGKETRERARGESEGRDLTFGAGWSRGRGIANEETAASRLILQHSNS